MAKWLIIAGVALVAIGGVAWLLQMTGISLGHLPGDINIRREGGSFHFPVVTCIIASIVLTILINLAMRFFR